MGWFPQQAGGLNRVFYNLLHHLPSSGVGVRGLVTGAAGIPPHVPVEVFARTDASLLRRMRCVRAAAQACLLDASPDIVVSHFALYTFPWLDMIGDRPLVVHFHGPWASESEIETDSSFVIRTKNWVEKAVYRRADRFIVLSSAFRDLLSRLYDVPLDRIEIIPGGVDVDQFRPTASVYEVRQRLGWPVDRPVVLSVRRLARRMGLENLIDAMRTVRQAVPGVLLLIAGSGPQANALQQRIDDQGLTDTVRLLGFVADADLPFAYQAANLTIVPTTKLEGFGLITIESLAAGTPVLVTPVGGLPETVASLDERLVIPGSTAEDLAGSLVRSLRSPAQLPSATACISYVRRHHDWSHIAAQTREVYAGVLSLRS
jgi:glycosyltransferase involved in cell wall biosynthesis